MRGSPSGTRRPVIGLVAAGVAGEEEDGPPALGRDWEGVEVSGEERRGQGGLK